MRGRCLCVSLVFVLLFPFTSHGEEATSEWIQGNGLTTSTATTSAALSFSPLESATGTGTGSPAVSETRAKDLVLRSTRVTSPSSLDVSPPVSTRPKGLKGSVQLSGGDNWPTTLHLQCSSRDTFQLPLFSECPEDKSSNPLHSPQLVSDLGLFCEREDEITRIFDAVQRHFHCQPTDQHILYPFSPPFPFMLGPDPFGVSEQQAISPLPPGPFVRPPHQACGLSENLPNAGALESPAGGPIGTSPFLTLPCDDILCSIIATQGGSQPLLPPGSPSDDLFPPPLEEEDDECPRPPEGGDGIFPEESNQDPVVEPKNTLASWVRRLFTLFQREETTEGGAQGGAESSETGQEGKSGLALGGPVLRGEQLAVDRARRAQVEKVCRTLSTSNPSALTGEDSDACSRLLIGIGNGQAESEDEKKTKGEGEGGEHAVDEEIGGNATRSSGEEEAFEEPFIPLHERPCFTSWTERKELAESALRNDQSRPADMLWGRASAALFPFVTSAEIPKSWGLPEKAKEEKEKEGEKEAPLEEDPQKMEEFVRRRLAELVRRMDFDEENPDAAQTDTESHDPPPGTPQRIPSSRWVSTEDCVAPPPPPLISRPRFPPSLPEFYVPGRSNSEVEPMTREEEEAAEAAALGREQALGWTLPSRRGGKSGGLGSSAPQQHGPFRRFLHGEYASADKIPPTLFDHASSDAGGRIFAYSRGMNNPKGVLMDDDDRYLLVPCALPNKWFVLALPDEIDLEKLAFFSQEFFASSFRHVQILGALKFPTAEWRLLAELELSSDRTQEIFDLSPFCQTLASKGCWVRYIKMRFLSNHDDEGHYYCSLTRLKIFGANWLTRIQSQLESDDAEADADEEDGWGQSEESQLEWGMGEQGGNGNGTATPGALRFLSAAAVVSHSLRQWESETTQVESLIMRRERDRGVPTRGPHSRPIEPSTGSPGTVPPVPDRSIVEPSIIPGLSDLRPASSGTPSAAVGGEPQRDSAGHSQIPKEGSMPLAENVASHRVLSESLLGLLPKFDSIVSRLAEGFSPSISLPSHTGSEEENKTQTDPAHPFASNGSIAVVNERPTPLPRAWPGGAPTIDVGGAPIVPPPLPGAVPVTGGGSELTRILESLLIKSRGRLSELIDPERANRVPAYPSFGQGGPAEGTQTQAPATVQDGVGPLGSVRVEGSAPLDHGFILPSPPLSIPVDPLPPSHGLGEKEKPPSLVVDREKEGGVGVAEKDKEFLREKDRERERGPVLLTLVDRMKAVEQQAGSLRQRFSYLQDGASADREVMLALWLLATHQQQQADVMMSQLRSVDEGLRNVSKAMNGTFSSHEGPSGSNLVGEGSRSRGELGGRTVLADVRMLMEETRKLISTVTDVFLSFFANTDSGGAWKEIACIACGGTSGGNITTHPCCLSSGGPKPERKADAPAQVERVLKCAIKCFSHLILQLPGIARSSWVIAQEVTWEGFLLLLLLVLQIVHSFNSRKSASRDSRGSLNLPWSPHAALGGGGGFSREFREKEKEGRDRRGREGGTRPPSGDREKRSRSHSVAEDNREKTRVPPRSILQSPATSSHGDREQGSNHRPSSSRREGGRREKKASPTGVNFSQMRNGHAEDSFPGPHRSSRDRGRSDRRQVLSHPQPESYASLPIQLNGNGQVVGAPRLPSLTRRGGADRENALSPRSPAVTVLKAPPSASPAPSDRIPSSLHPANGRVWPSPAHLSVHPSGERPDHRGSRSSNVANPDSAVDREPAGDAMNGNEHLKASTAAVKQQKTEWSLSGFPRRSIGAGRRRWLFAFFLRAGLHGGLLLLRFYVWAFRALFACLRSCVCGRRGEEECDLDGEDEEEEGDEEEGEDEANEGGEGGSEVSAGEGRNGHLSEDAAHGESPVEGGPFSSHHTPSDGSSPRNHQSPYTNSSSLHSPSMNPPAALWFHPAPAPHHAAFYFAPQLPPTSLHPHYREGLPPDPSQQPFPFLGTAVLPMMPSSSSAAPMNGSRRDTVSTSGGHQRGPTEDRESPTGEGGGRMKRKSHRGGQYPHPAEDTQTRAPAEQRPLFVYPGAPRPSGEGERGGAAGIPVGPRDSSASARSSAFGPLAQHQGFPFVPQPYPYPYPPPAAAGGGGAFMHAPLMVGMNQRPGGLQVDGEGPGMPPGVWWVPAPLHVPPDPGDGRQQGRYEQQQQQQGEASNRWSEGRQGRPRRSLTDGSGRRDGGERGWEGPGSYAAAGREQVRGPSGSFTAYGTGYHLYPSSTQHSSSFMDSAAFSHRGGHVPAPGDSARHSSFSRGGGASPPAAAAAPESGPFFALPSRFPNSTQEHEGASGLGEQSLFWRASPSATALHSSNVYQFGSVLPESALAASIRQQEAESQSAFRREAIPSPKENLQFAPKALSPCLQPQATPTSALQLPPGSFAGLPAPSDGAPAVPFPSLGVSATISDSASVNVTGAEALRAPAKIRKTGTLIENVLAPTVPVPADCHTPQNGNQTRDRDTED
uniref:SUN domain-containing protein n=1 Tax=Chromera velia CCMP2878 TaxID=1169474 RepID=A0A0G4GRD2_9ALVE|eukprot:Cvel_23033.t1-p1 / transcript=Cvel_23033.t1 / gene=Cvel_23033 / organism=Chromera_velia_CCMP2878 / gene_product=SUN domain-containing protein 2, putative / transcript_product=SUN domain-containing protein 2, putative / location=Cvel_scaffold2328:5235-15962(+) / protein_length=2470 / sequence_SO=supercontig / SO=protein_coding / is_pseudo=false